MKRNLVLLIFLLSQGWLQAQTPQSLKECIAYGLKNHLSVQVNNNNIAKANAQVQENYSAYLPQVYGSVQLTDNLKLPTTIIPAGIFGPEESQIKFGTQYSNQATIEADQTIYDQTLLTGFKELRPGIEIAKMNARQNDENIIYNISYFYYQGLVYKKQIALLQESEIKYEKLTQITQLQIAKGVAKSVDLSRIQVSLNNTKSQISQSQNNYDLTLNRLKSAMGLKMSDELSIQDSIIADSYVPSVVDNEPFKVENRADFKSQELNALLLDLERKRILAGYAPKISAFAQYGAQAFGDELDKSYNNWYDFSAIGLKLQVPIFDGLYKRAKSREAKITFDNSIKNLEMNKQAYELDYFNSTTQLLRNTENVETDKQNVNLAREVFNNTALQYQQGIASLSDLLNAELSFKEAQTNLVNSLLNFYLAKLELEKSKGTLKTYYQNL